MAGISEVLARSMAVGSGLVGLQPGWLAGAAVLLPGAVRLRCPVSPRPGGG